MAPQPVGASIQLGKEQALPCAENLVSQCGVRLCEYDSLPHGRARPSSTDLPEFLKRHECGSTETVSEAPGSYGIRSCSHADLIASNETTSALATLPSPKMGMVPRYTSSKHHSGLSLLPQPLDGPRLSSGLGAPRTSVPAYCFHNRCLQHQELSTRSHISGNRGYNSNRVRSLLICYSYCFVRRLYGNQYNHTVL